MSDEELDPEVRADLELRARSEHDPTRTRKPTLYTPPAVVGVVPCRSRCGAVVEWNEVAEYRFVMFNRALEKRGEPPMDKTRIMFCDACRAQGTKLSAERNRKQVDVIAELVRQLKAAQNPDAEVALIQKLERARHPDVAGLLDALRNKAAREPASRRKKRGEVLS